MAARNPPLWLQAGSHPATNDRLLLEALMAPPPAVVSGAGYGIVGPSDLAVTQNGTPNMSVNVAAGKAFIDGTENANQGAYLAVNDATVNLAISASSPTNPRKDLVVAKVQDAEWSGATNSWSLAVVTGTPAASPAEPAVPANAVVLALVDVAANATSITNANITDRRRRAVTLGGIVVCTSTTRPTTGLYEGLFIYETDTDKVYVYSGTAWGQVGLRYGPPACRINDTSGASITTGGVEKVFNFNAQRWNTDNMWVIGSPSRITFNTPGLYVVTAQMVYSANVNGDRVVSIRLNGTTYIVYKTERARSGGAGSHILECTTQWKMAQNDYIETLVFQDSGSTLTATAFQSTGPEMSATWIGSGN